MSDLISREAALDAIESNYRKMGLSHNDGAKLERMLKALPSADREDYEKGYKDGQLAVMTGNDEKEFERGYRMGQAADRPKGEWVFKTNIPIRDGASSAGYVCSVCGCDVFRTDGMNFCPNCGAKMDK